MQYDMKTIAGWLVLSWLLLAVTACAGLSGMTVGPVETLNYRNVQQRFDEAVQQDNPETLQRALQPFTEQNNADLLYQQVANELSDERIANLDARLRANAWLLRGVSEWRLGQLDAALASAQAGLREPQLRPNSRDAVLLTLLPALIIDAEIQRDWRLAGSKLTAAEYPAYQTKFETAMKEFAKAEQAIGPATPDGAVYYLRYQKWRVLQNWRAVIGSIDDRNARNNARQAAKNVLGGDDLRKAALKQRDQIPQNYPLRQLITTQGG
jgi:hypothetical protein